MMAWLESFFKKDEGYKAYKGNKRKMPRNVYDKNVTFDTHVKRFHIIHFVFKYRFVVPLLLIANKILGKHIVKKIDNQSYNRNINLFDKAFEEAMKKWYTYYMRNSGEPQKRPSKQKMLKAYKGNTYLRSMKNYVLTMYTYDTAYREFFNILMHEIANHMVKEYTKPEYKNKKTGHLFFTTDIYEQNYFVLEKAIRYNTELSVQEGEKLLNDYWLYHPKNKNRKVRTITGTATGTGKIEDANITSFEKVVEAENVEQKNNIDNL